MKIEVNYNKREFKKDHFNLIKEDLKGQKYFFFLILFFLLIVMIHILNRYEIISFMNKVISFLMYSVGFGIGGMLCYTIIHNLVAVIKILKASKKIPIKSEYILINKEKIEFSWEGHINKYYLNMFKEAIIINETIFLNPIKRDMPIIRLNSKEIGKKSYQDVLTLLNKVWK